MIENMLKDISDYLMDNNTILIYPKSEEEKIAFKKLIVHLQLPIAFTDLSTEDKNILLLRYLSYIKEDDYIKNNLNTIKKSQKNKDYKSALEAGLNLLKIGNPNITGYMKVAILYLKLKDFDNAIKYLEISYYIDKYEGHDIQNMARMIEHVKKVIVASNNPELIEYYDSFLSSIEDYLNNNDNECLNISIKKEEFDLFKFFIGYYTNLTFIKRKNGDNHNIRIRNMDRK